MLLTIAIWDARTLRIPDMFSLPLIAFGLLFAWLLDLELAGRLAGAALGYAALWGVAWFYRRTRGRDGLGLGDAKLLAAGGAWLGWAALPFVVLVGSFTGLAHALVLGVLSRGSREGTLRDQALPFGPHLALAIFIVWLGGDLAGAGVWR